MPAPGTRASRWCGSIPAALARVVVDNIGIYNKVLRGVYAASYSLLCDATGLPRHQRGGVLPDDFPSPVPAAMAPISAGITA